MLGNSMPKVKLKAIGTLGNSMPKVRTKMIGAAWKLYAQKRIQAVNVDGGFGQESHVGIYVFPVLSFSCV